MCVYAVKYFVCEAVCSIKYMNRYVQTFLYILLLPLIFHILITATFICKFFPIFFLFLSLLFFFVSFRYLSFLILSLCSFFLPFCIPFLLFSFFFFFFFSFFFFSLSFSFPFFCFPVDDDMKLVSRGVKGNILVRGPPCFGGERRKGRDGEREREKKK